MQLNILLKEKVIIGPYASSNLDNIVLSFNNKFGINIVFIYVVLCIMLWLHIIPELYKVDFISNFCLPVLLEL